MHCSRFHWKESQVIYGAKLKRHFSFYLGRAIVHGKRLAE